MIQYLQMELFVLYGGRPDACIVLHLQHHARGSTDTEVRSPKHCVNIVYYYYIPGKKQWCTICSLILFEANCNSLGFKANSRTSEREGEGTCIGIWREILNKSTVVQPTQLNIQHFGQIKKGKIHKKIDKIEKLKSRNLPSFPRLCL